MCSTDFVYLQHEISILGELDHPNIIKIYETFGDLALSPSQEENYSLSSPLYRNNNQQHNLDLVHHDCKDEIDTAKFGS